MPTPVFVNSAASSTASAPGASVGLRGWWREMRQHQFLISQLTRREVSGRYRGSHLGILWSFVNPLLMLCIYTVVFKYIFGAKPTGHAEEGWADFALMLFSALIIFNVFAECLNRAPNLMLLNANYVTKVVFPLEILPLTAVLGSLVHLLIGFVPLVFAAFITRGGHLHATAALWPLLLVPITFWALGVTWIVSAIGAFLRDLNEVMVAFTQILMYASAVFYSLKFALEKVPPAFHPIFLLNPLVFFCEQSRDLVVWGEGMNWTGYAVATVTGFLVMVTGYKLFVNVKPAFADVI